MEQNLPQKTVQQTSETSTQISVQNTQSNKVIDVGNIWDQQPGEPDVDYKKFLIYQGLGLARSLKAANEKGLGKPIKGPTGNWKRAAKQWNWFERATAWDKREVQRAVEDNISFRHQAETNTEAAIAKMTEILRECIEAKDEAKFAEYSRKLNLLIFGAGRAGDLLLRTHKALFGEKQKIEETHNFNHLIMEFK